MAGEDKSVFIVPPLQCFARALPLTSSPLWSHSHKNGSNYDRYTLIDFYWKLLGLWEIVLFIFIRSNK